MQSRPLPNATPCDPETLRRYLSGECETEEEDRFEQHLNDCLTCRRSLEHHAAEPDFWKTVATQLDTRHDIATETNRLGFVSCDFELGIGLGINDYLQRWLAPSKNPQSLGRLEQFEITDVVGLGGMGLVLQAFDSSLQRTVAIKTLRHDLSANKEAKERFRREAQLAASIHHPHVISIFHVGSWRDVDYIVMPLVEDGALKDACREKPLSLKDVLKVSRQVASGLAAAHERGMIHRDVKPSNVLLLEGLDQVCVADFGLARVMGDDGMTLTGEIHGTPQFMSPEQASGQTLDSRSDLFSLGCLIYWMALGRSPFQAENQYATLTKISRAEFALPTSLNPSLPPWFDQLIQRLLVLEPSHRQPNASGWVQVIDELLQYQADPDKKRLPKILQESNSFGSKLVGIAGGVVSLAILLLLPTWLKNDTNQTISDPVDAAAIPERSSNGNAEAVTTLVRTGPLDELDRVNLLTDLKARVRVKYWLERLASLDVHAIPPEAIQPLNEIAVHGAEEERSMAESLLKRNPFEEVSDENPFVLVE